MVIVKKKSWKTSLSGKVLAKGTQLKMKALKVLDNGELRPDGDLSEDRVVGTRFSELLRQRQCAGRGEHLSELDNDLIENGGQSTLEAGTSVKEIRRGPIKRTANSKVALNEKLQKLRCMEYKPRPYLELVPNKGIFADQSTLRYVRDLYNDNPSKLFRSVLNILLADVIDSDGLSRTGTRGTVKVPDVVFEVAHEWTQYNINPTAPNYDLKCQIRNFLGKSGKEARVKAIENHGIEDTNYINDASGSGPSGSVTKETGQNSSFGGLIISSSELLR